MKDEKETSWKTEVYRLEVSITNEPKVKEVSVIVNDSRYTYNVTDRVEPFNHQTFISVIKEALDENMHYVFKDRGLINREYESSGWVRQPSPCKVSHQD